MSTLFEKYIGIGREEGREEGDLTGRINILQEILQMPITPRNKLLEKSIPELKKILETLRNKHKNL